MKKKKSLVGWVDQYFGAKDLRFVGQPQFIDMPKILRGRKHIWATSYPKKVRITIEEL